MNEYRCTRNQPYEAKGCPGYGRLAERQGYYIQAPNEFSALRQMEDQHFADISWADRNGVEPFTVRLWIKCVGEEREEYHGI